jgi:hypothetical protein
MNINTGVKEKADKKEKAEAPFESNVLAVQ